MRAIKKTIGDYWTARSQEKFNLAGNGKLQKKVLKKEQLVCYQKGNMPLTETPKSGCRTRTVVLMLLVMANIFVIGDADHICAKRKSTLAYYYRQKHAFAFLQHHFVYTVCETVKI